MKENFIDLTDGTRLSVRVNFGTIYYLQKQKGFYRIQKKAEKNKKKLTEEESFEPVSYTHLMTLEKFSRARERGTL